MPITRVMVLALNSLLYLVALGLSLALLAPAPAGATRRVRASRAALVCGGAVAMSAAIALTLLGYWLAAAMTGSCAVVIVAICMWIALSARFAPRSDDDGGDDGGGGPPKDPEPPLPTTPVGGPVGDLWAEFDRVRAGWARDRAPSLS